MGVVEANQRPGVGGVDHLTRAHVDPDVVDSVGSGAEEDQVARLDVGTAGYRRSGVELVLCHPGDGEAACASPEQSKPPFPVPPHT